MTPTQVAEKIDEEIFEKNNSYLCDIRILLKNKIAAAIEEAVKEAMTKQGLLDIAVKFLRPEVEQARKEERERVIEAGKIVAKQVYDKGVREERERCAKIAMEHSTMGWEDIATRIAAQIRSGE